MGVVYLIHFDEPYEHARHYLGYTKCLTVRLALHRSGQGARLIQVIQEAGIGWTLATWWRGDRSLERRLKNWHNAKKLCPICRAEKVNQIMAARRTV